MGDVRMTRKTRVLLEMILCAQRCRRDCRSYRTPLGSCYNGRSLFPGDPSWGEFDVVDRKEEEEEDSPFFERSFYATTDASCGGGTPTDVYELPLNECIGPFGKPRPWGNFTI